MRFKEPAVRRSAHARGSGTVEKQNRSGRPRAHPGAGGPERRRSASASGSQRRDIGVGTAIPVPSDALRTGTVRAPLQTAAEPARWPRTPGMDAEEDAFPGIRRRAKGNPTNSATRQCEATQPTRRLLRIPRLPSKVVRFRLFTMSFRRDRGILSRSPDCAGFRSSRSQPQEHLLKAGLVPVAGLAIANGRLPTASSIADAQGARPPLIVPIGNRLSAIGNSLGLSGGRFSFPLANGRGLLTP
jgi:hypothetical protein